MFVNPSNIVCEITKNLTKFHKKNMCEGVRNISLLSVSFLINLQASIFVKIILRRFSLLLRTFITGSSRPEVFYKHQLFKKFAKFLGKHLHRSLFFDKVASWIQYDLQMRFRYRCFPVKLFLRIL